MPSASFKLAITEPFAPTPDDHASRLAAHGTAVASSTIWTSPPTHTSQTATRWALPASGTLAETVDNGCAPTAGDELGVVVSTARSLPAAVDGGPPDVAVVALGDAVAGPVVDATVAVDPQPHAAPDRTTRNTNIAGPRTRTGSSHHDDTLG